MKKMLKDPVVETTASIKAFLTSNRYNTDNCLIIKADTTTAQQKLFMGMTVGYYVFDSTGALLCYNGSSTCRGEQFRQLLDNQPDSFQQCRNNSITLQRMLADTYNLDEQPMSLEQFSAAHYYVVAYWQKFLGGKRGYTETVSWMEEAISKHPSRSTFTFIKINTDLQENWGLVAGKKATLDYTMEKNSLTIRLKNLPVRHWWHKADAFI